MAAGNSAPILSTPETSVLERQALDVTAEFCSNVTHGELYRIFEIDQTVVYIRKHGYFRVALQFPDNLLTYAPRVVNALQEALRAVPPASVRTPNSCVDSPSISDPISGLSLSLAPQSWMDQAPRISKVKSDVKLFILGDTSYGACCIDEIAAEHANADAVVHYGRACLSPTSRVPALHIFTQQILPHKEALLQDFRKTYPDLDQKIVLMADLTYQSHLPSLSANLKASGFTNIHEAQVLHEPTSPIPNRTVPEEVASDSEKLKDWHLFHVAEPPKALLLILSSRVASISIYQTADVVSGRVAEVNAVSSRRALSRRYALLTSVSTVSTFGILINTLSVKHYIHIVDQVRQSISAAGKKSYVFVVGKLNAAKVANFSEIGAWVVIGCWESSLIDNQDFWKPVITPFELNLALQEDGERLWTGDWCSNFQQLLRDTDDDSRQSTKKGESGSQDGTVNTCTKHLGDDQSLSEPESAPPEYDLRTGRYISQSRPMKVAEDAHLDFPSGTKPPSNGLVLRAKGDMVAVGLEASPGADFLHSKRTWRGLGSDFEIAYEQADTALEEGRSGIARGYRQSDGESRT